MDELFIKLLCSPVETSYKQNKRVEIDRQHWELAEFGKKSDTTINRLLNGRIRDTKEINLVRETSYESVKANNKEKAANLKGSSMHGTK